MAAPRVSVVMGVYNAATHLDATMSALLKQDYPSFECIVIDDGSTDATFERLTEYAQADPRLRILQQPHSGLTQALRHGCETAQGEFIVRHDAGDWSASQRIARQVAVMDAYPNVVFAACWSEFVGPEGEHLYTARGLDLSNQPVSLPARWTEQGTQCTDGPSSHAAVIMRRRAYQACGGYRLQFRLAQDWDLWYRLALLGDFLAHDELLYHACFRLGDSSMGKRRLQHRLGRLARSAFDARLEGRSDAPVLAQAAQLSARAVRPATAVARARGAYFLGSCLRHNGDKRAGRYFARATELNPWHWRAWIRRWQMRAR